MPKRRRLQPCYPKTVRLTQVEYERSDEMVRKYYDNFSDLMREALNVLIGLMDVWEDVLDVCDRRRISPAAYIRGLIREDLSHPSEQPVLAQ